MSRTLVITTFFLLLQVWAMGQWQSVGDGDFSSENSWLSNSEFKLEALDLCAWSSTKFTVEHQITLHCGSPAWYGKSEVFVINGGNLTILEKTEIFGNASIYIASDSKLKIQGDLVISGNASFKVDGKLIVDGDIIIKGDQSSICGEGIAAVQGKINGEGWCKTLRLTKPILTKVQTQVEKNEVSVHVQPVGLEKNYAIEIQRSLNGLTYQSIEIIRDQLDQPFVIKDARVGQGTRYYKTLIYSAKGKIIGEYVNVVHLNDADGNGCEIEIRPNPCVPNCTAEIIDCPDGNYNVNILDARGNEITQVLYSEKSKTNIRYSINKENYLAPGLYVLVGKSGDTSLSKKLILK